MTSLFLLHINISKKKDIYIYSNIIKEENTKNKKEKEIIKEKPHRTRKEFVPPTYEEVLEYARSRGREDLAKAFFDYYDVGDWKDKNGDKVREYHRKSYQRVAEYRRENGLCTSCGGNRDDKYVMCSRCRAKNTEKCRKSRNKNGNRQQYWRENGLCIRCGDKVKHGYKLCEKHYQINVEISHKRTKNQIGSEYWRNSNNLFFVKVGVTNG